MLSEVPVRWLTKAIILVALVIVVVVAWMDARALPPIPPCAGFTDVLSDSPSCPAIAWAKENGITTGCGQGRFCPKDPVTREQMVLMLYRASKVPPCGNPFATVCVRFEAGKQAAPLSFESPAAAPAPASAPLPAPGGAHVVEPKP